MTNSNFIDYVKIFCRSGKGGAGIVHFRREKFVPKGGPDGGDGGRGGHIILRGNKQLWTLLHLKYTKHIFAENGKTGEKSLKKGADGKDFIIEVPIGTIVKNAESQEQIIEIIEDKEEKILLEGGLGGLGNNHFKSSTNQTPRYAQPGIPAKESWFIFELKVLADVGLVGYPNAGKSTLLSVLSKAKPKIADYPFTTIVPNLGIVEYRDYKSFIMADIPGIIKGAAKGKGLGHRFLRHIERNSVLLFLIPANSENIKQEYDVLIKELSEYNPELLDKKRILAISKSDLIDAETEELLKAKLPNKISSIFISSISNKNLDKLKDVLWQNLTSND